MDRKKQYIAVGIIGVSFMLMFTAFNSLQNMISELYESLGLGPLGQIALFCIYGAFGLTTLVSSYLIEKMGYKKTMFLSGLGYAVFELTGLLVTSCKSADSHTGVCSVGFIYFLVLFGALICGFSAALIWVPNV
jgi:fucose permease